MQIDSHGLPVSHTIITAAEESARLTDARNPRLYMQIWYNLETGEIYHSVVEDKTFNSLKKPSNSPAVLYICNLYGKTSEQSIMNKIRNRLCYLANFLPSEFNPTFADIDPPL